MFALDGGVGFLRFGGVAPGRGRVQGGGDGVLRNMARADGLARGVAPGTVEAGELAEQHRASIEKFYDCSYEMQVCLAQMYVADERFTKHYDDIAPGLAQYVHDVIVANAEQQN